MEWRGRPALAKSWQGPCSGWAGAVNESTHPEVGLGAGHWRTLCASVPPPTKLRLLPSAAREPVRSCSRYPAGTGPCWCQNKGAIPPDCLGLARGLAHGAAQGEPLGHQSRGCGGLWPVPETEPPWRVLSDPRPKGARAASLGLTFSTLMLAFALVSMNLIP